MQLAPGRALGGGPVQVCGARGAGLSAPGGVAWAGVTTSIDHRGVEACSTARNPWSSRLPGAYVRNDLGSGTGFME
ncbi:MAG: hypothetical protein KC766_22030, partial [Myxococcales bacterium]|nr:hypothetical protein [Myxococcales bacterium]